MGRHIQMKWLVSWCVLVCVMLGSIGMMTGCAVPSSAISTNTVLTPPSSQYLADIIGRVTVISNSVVKGGSPLPNTVQGSQFWVVQLFVKNKGYQMPVRFGPNNVPWYIRTTSGQDYPQDVGIVPDWIGGSSVTIPQGSEGQVTLLFIVHPAARQSSSGGIFFDITPTPNNCQLRYIGSVPQGSNSSLMVDSFGSLVYTGSVAEVYDWDSQSVVQVPKHTSPSPTRAEPSGTYLATIYGIEQTLTFKGNVLEIYNRVDGKHVYKYAISEDGSTLTTTDIVTNTPKDYSFKYIKEYECIASDVGIGKTPFAEYYKR